MRSHRAEEHCEETLALWQARKDITLEELRVELTATGLTIANSTLHPSSPVIRLRGKKDRSRGRGPRQGRVWSESQLDLAPERLVFIDERTATNMARSHGRAPKGEHLPMSFPHGHRKTTTWSRPAHHWGDCADGRRRVDQRQMV